MGAHVWNSFFSSLVPVTTARRASASAARPLTNHLATSTILGLVLSTWELSGRGGGGTGWRACWVESRVIGG